MQTVLSITALTGRLHPLLVHLPLGILLAALAFWLLSKRERHAALRPAMNLLLLAGAVTAIGSCISGYVLSQDGGYDETLVGRHQWAGIFTAAVSLFFYYLHRADSRIPDRPLVNNTTAILLAAGLFWTGHLGGSLTHGDGYLTEAITGGDASIADTIPIVPDVQEARLYKDLAQPLLTARCVSCHGPGKQKGRLRLDGLDNIRKGGKDGDVVLEGSPEKSELIKRLLLPAEDEHRMPPKGKPQLTAPQVALLKWWVKVGIATEKKVKDIPQTDSLRKMLAVLQTKAVEGHAGLTIPGLPTQPVAAADPKVIDSLKARGIVVMPVASGNPYLMANLVNANLGGDSAALLLAGIKDQLVNLKMGSSGLTDKGCRSLARLKKLVWLRIDDNPVSDTGVRALSALDSLRTISLTGTRVTKDGVTALASLSHLGSIYLFRTAVKTEDWAAMVKAFPHTRLDSGGYRQESLESDTTLVKRKKAVDVPN
jgi:mono/diheme cytochrome c family protein/uncharacterized membrane protein